MVVSMSEANGHEPEPVPEPVAIVAGHLVIYDDTAAGRGYALVFTRDDNGEKIMPQLPAMVLPLLAKVLNGDELTSGDMPGGAVMRAAAARVMGGLNG
jgi:hypothetical protein